MALQKFEQESRKELRDREIKPSADSWIKLEKQLNAKESKKVSRSIWWIAAAACIAAVMFIGNYGFTSAEDPAVPQVVVNPLVEDDAQQSVIEVTEELEKVREGKVQVEKEELTPIAGNDEIKKMASEKSTAISEEDRITAAPEVQVGLETSEDTENTITHKLEGVVAEEALVEKKGFEVSEGEVDALLQRAAAEIHIERQAGTRSASIDAESLLWEVERELERSFRDKVFEVLKEGYLRTKTAVANRSF